MRVDRLREFVDPSCLPGRRDHLVRAAHGRQAPADVVARLGTLPPDQVFFSIDDVMAVLGRRLDVPAPR